MNVKEIVGNNVIVELMVHEDLVEIEWHGNMERKLGLGR